MSVPSRFLDPQYINWLRCASSLVILKESLHDYTEAGVRRLYSNIKHNVTSLLGSHFQCSACSWKGIRQQHSTGVWYIRCTKSICNVWLGEILSKHDDPQCRTINWGNADITKWSTEPWEIAKIFMTNGQRNKTDLPRELDSPALLSLLKYCKEFHPISVQLVSDIIEIRNKVLHSPDLRVSDQDKDTWIDRMLLLVSSLNIQGVTYTNIDKLKTEDLGVSFQDQEIKALQNLVSEVLNEVTTLKGDSESLKNTQSQHQKEIDKVIRAGGDNEAKIIGLQTLNQQLETDLKGQKSQLETYTQVISTLKTFLDNNPDLSSIKISEELRASSNEIKALQTKLQTVESQLENIKGELILIRVDQEAMKTKMTIVKSGQEKMRVEQEAVKRRMTAVRGEQKKMRVEQVAMRNQIEILERDQKEKQTEIQPPVLSTVNMQRLQKNLLHRYKFLNVIPISPLHESYTILLDDIFTSVIIEKKDIDTLGNLWEQGQLKNSKDPIYLRSYHQLFGDKGNKRLILKGFMGSGKTVFCRKVVQTWCSIKTAQVDPESSGERQVASTSALDGEDILSQFEFLFFIDLAKVNSQEDFIHAIHGQCSIPNDIEFLCKLLQEMPEKILIILDGLDEIGPETVDFVNDLLERKLYPQITVLVSTRPWQVSKLCLQAHSHYDLLLDLQGFDEESAFFFAAKVVQAHDKDFNYGLIKNMFESLTRKKIFATFRSVPLLLLFLTNVWYTDRTLPDQYSVLYGKIIDCMTECYLKKTKGKHRNLSWVEMSDSKTKTMESSVFVKTFGSKFLELTCKLSYQFLLRRQHGISAVISRDELLKILDKDEETAESKLCVLLDCGILSKSDAFSPLERNYSVSFLHLTIQEFLTAVHLTLNEVVFREFISSWTCLDDVLQYENLVIFICGLAPNLGTLLFRHICEVCDNDSKVLEYRYHSVHCIQRHAINNLCSLYQICLNEVQGSASLPLSDITIMGSSSKEPENFLYKTMNLDLTFTIKSLCLFCVWGLSTDRSESLCKIISNCTHLLSLVLWWLELHDGILNLSRLTDLTYLELWNVIMSSECSKSICRSISYCTHLHTLDFYNISLHDSILDLSRLTGLTNIKLWNVTMYSVCSKSICRSISNSTHLQNLHLFDIELYDSILDLSRLTGLTDLRLSNVTMSSECSEFICRSISTCTHLKKLDLENNELNDSILDLSRLTDLTDLRLCNVTMSSECSEFLCRSISNCTHLKKLDLENNELNDSILDLSKLTGLTDLKLCNVTIFSECNQSLCRSISNCTHLQTLDLSGIKLHDIILDLRRLTDLTYLKLWSITMSSECRESLCKNINNFTHLKTLHLEDIKLYDSILDMSRLTGLTILNLQCVTMSSVNSKSLHRSISNCTHLHSLDLSSIALHESIPDLNRLIGLTDLKLHNVTMSSKCSKSLCRSISNCTHLQRLVLMDIKLHDNILELRRLTGLTILSLRSVTMSSECSKFICSSISNCSHLQSLHLEDIKLHDSILDLSILTCLNSLYLRSVTMSSENSKSLCRSISNCTRLQIVDLSSISLHESIIDTTRLTGLTYLRLHNVTMSIECSESLQRSISNCTLLQTLNLNGIILRDSGMVHVK